MKHIHFFLIGFLAVLASIGDAPAAPPTPDDLRFEIRKAVDFWKTPGIAVVIVRDDKVLLLEGFGVRQAGRNEPVTSDTLFPLASCTKAFTSIAFAQLVDDRIVRWDDPVRRHLPTFRLADPNANELVTLRDLMCHRTGVGGHDNLWYWAPWSQDECIQRIGRMPPDGHFRSTFAYQSIMYMAVGRVIDRRTASGWEQHVRARILKPLEMNATCLTSIEADRCADRAVGHRQSRDEQVVAVEQYPMKEANAAGSVFVNASDLANWLRFHLGDGTWGGKRLISSAGLAETHLPQTIIPLRGLARSMNPETIQLGYAMGWVVQDYRGKPMLSHGGWIDGFRAQLTLLPENRIGLGILMNLHATRMGMALSQRLVDRLLELPERDWHRLYGDLTRQENEAEEQIRRDRQTLRRQGRRASAPAPAFAGEYVHPAFGECKITLKDGRLEWKWSSFSVMMQHVAGDLFELPSTILNDPAVEFEVENRRVQSMKTLGVVWQRKKNEPPK